MSHVQTLVRCSAANHESLLTLLHERANRGKIAMIAQADG